MTQTKKKSQKSTSKKQAPIVQITKEGMVELLTVVKDFLSEELTIRLGSTNRRVEMLQRQVFGIKEIVKTPPTLVIPMVDVCRHKERLESISYSRRTGAFLSANYKCTWCGREARKTWIFLSWKEKRALKKLGVTIK